MFIHSQSRSENQITTYNINPEAKVLPNHQLLRNHGSKIKAIEIPKKKVATDGINSMVPSIALMKNY
jgi:hypothetical protein